MREMGKQSGFASQQALIPDLRHLLSVHVHADHGAEADHAQAAIWLFVGRHRGAGQDFALGLAAQHESAIFREDHL